MKIKIIILSLMLYQLLTASAFAQTVQVTSADALSIAQNQFKGQDVDYYLIPDSTDWKIFVDAEPLEDGQIQLTATDEFDLYYWTDASGEMRGESNSIIVKPTMGSNSYIVSAVNGDGEYAESEITIDNPMGIESIAVNPSEIEINFRETTCENSYIRLMNTQDSSIMKFEKVPAEEKRYTLNISDCKSGMYIIQYIIGSEVVDVKKIAIQ